MVFLSQILPSSFSDLKRFQVTQILLFEAPYVPTCVVKAPGHTPRAFYGNLYDNYRLLSTRAFHSNTLPTKLQEPNTTMSLGGNGQGWPKNRIPTEIYERITEFLPRDSIETMRLVCKEFEVNVSSMLFQFVVVPFRPEIYGMIITASRRLVTKDVKGKGKAKETDETDKDIGDAPFGIYDQKLKADGVQQGMLVFKGWGPRIQKFAMTFEVDGCKSNTNPCAIKATFSIFFHLDSALIVCWRFCFVHCSFHTFISCGRNMVATRLRSLCRCAPPFGSFTDSIDALLMRC